MFKITAALLAAAAAHAAVRHVLWSKGEKFSITLWCEEGDGRCKDVQEGLRLATGFIENAFSLRGPINVEVEFLDSFLGKPWEGTGLVGSTATFFSSKRVDKVLVQMDRALFKQDPANTLEDPEAVDFKLYINSYKDYYFPSQFGSGQGENQYSILDLIAHEFLHGMGFRSFLDEGPLNSAIAPHITTRKGRYENTAGIEFSGNTFDQFVFNKNGVSIASAIAKMNRVDEVPLDSVKEDGVELFHPHLRIARILERYATTPGRLYFETDVGNHVFLETRFSKFQSGDSISHIEISHKGTKEGLMAYGSHKGSGVHDLPRDREWLTSPFGPLTVEIMRTLGYEENPHSSFKHSLQGFAASWEN